MKKNLPVTGTQRTLPADAELISATDTKGIIRHANQAFMEFSAFGSEELIGRNHNIVRHPDMPPAAFANLWERLKKGEPWMGIVKNRCKNGDHYWVDAFVTPSIENDRVVGYESVRVAPDAKAVKRAEALYAKLWKTGKDAKRPRGGLTLKLGLAFSTVAAIGIFAGALATGTSVITATLVWLFTSTAGFAASHLLLSGLRKAARDARKLIDNPTMQAVYTGRHDEVGNLEFAIKTLQAQLRTVLGRIRESADDVSSESESLNNTATAMTDSMKVQRKEIDMITTAVEEMSASVNKVVCSAATSSAATEATNARAVAGQRAVESAVASARQVADGVSHAASTIESLEQDSESIGTVLVVIRGIADQTNLLALNAAIEAARAGEQGRGFAVVADEVRTLASRTQASTAEIQEMIESFQGTAKNAVSAMELSQAQVADSVENTQQVGIELQDIFNQVAALEEMGRAIAAAAEEQSGVSKKISSNLDRIGEATVDLSAGGQSTREIGQKVSSQAAELKTLIRRFRI